MRSTPAKAGTLPATELVPLEYRTALDAAMSYLQGAGIPLASCRVPDLAAEVEQRTPARVAEHETRAAILVEPLAGTWREDVAELGRKLAPSGLLLVIASRPFASVLLGRPALPDRPVGTAVRGLDVLCHGLADLGFRIREIHGFHSPLAIGLSVLSRAADRCGRPDLGDRLLARSRMHYTTRGPLSSLCTVALIVAVRGATR